MNIELLVLLFTPFIFFVSSLFSSLLNDKYINKINVAGGIFLILVGVSFHILYVLAGNPVEHYSLYVDPGIGEVYGFIVDPLSAGFALIICVVAGAIMIYSTSYMSPENNYHPVTRGKARYYAWMYLFITSVLLFIFSSNLLQLLITFELMTLACWGLISYYGGSEALRSSYKMLVITHLGAYGGLGIAVAYMLYSYKTTLLSALSMLGPGEKLVITGLVMWAAITKSSQFPTYSWLPDAMVAPTPTSALLHGATMIEMGPYLVARILYSMGQIPFNTGYVILVPTVLTLLVATTMYPVLKDGKRLLAYSTVAEASVMYFMVSLMIYSVKMGLVLFMFYFTVHAFLKSLGFLLMGSAGYSIGTHELTKVMEYIGSSRLLYNLLMTVLLGLSGIPIYAVAKIYCLINAGAVLSNIPYAVAYIVVLIESIVFLVVSMKWLNTGLRSSPGGYEGLPVYMLVSLLILLFGLYFFQIYCFTEIIPAIRGVM